MSCYAFLSCPANGPAAAHHGVRQAAAGHKLILLVGALVGPQAAADPPARPRARVQ